MSKLYAIYNRPENGHSCDQEISKKLLVLNQKYEVKHIEMGQSNTSVYLKDFPDNVFNSVQFVFVENNKLINIFEDPRYNPYISKKQKSIKDRFTDYTGDYKPTEWGTGIPIGREE